MQSALNSVLRQDEFVRDSKASLTTADCLYANVPPAEATWCNAWPLI